MVEYIDRFKLEVHAVCEMQTDKHIYFEIVGLSAECLD
jgi:hypothetical protein